MRVRIKFEKLDKVKFISHLDLLKTFQRALRRANIKVKYSKGFNPHMVINIARPLSVGFTSTCEFMDIEVEEDKTVDIIKQDLNLALPNGINILDIILLNKYNDCNFKYIKYAVYDIEIEIDRAINFEEEYKKLTEINVLKKDKNIEIKPLINYLYITQTGNKIHIETKLSACNESTLNPQLLIKALELNMVFNAEYATYNRSQLIFDIS